MKSTNIYFHVGLPKSASTWIQSIGFPSLSNINYIGRKYNLSNFDAKTGKPPKVRDDVNSALTHLSKAHPHSYNQERVIEIIGSKLKKGVPNVLSTEQLSETSNYYQAANRIKEAFPGSSIILFIRAQQSIIESIYLNELRKGCIESLPDLINDTCENRQRIIGRSEIWLDHYDYLKMLEMYESIFGVGKVLVLPIELIKIDISKFTERLATFLQIDYDAKWVGHLQSSMRVNKGGSSLMDVTSWLFLNRLHYLLPNMLKKRIKNRRNRIVRATRWIRTLLRSDYNNILDSEMIKDKYSESNNQLSNILEIDLSELGYKVK